MTAPRNSILHGDALTMLKTLPDTFVQCVITSPPYYGLRSYLPKEHPNKPLEIGAEETPEDYIDRLVEVFHEVKRVLRPDGVAWVNIGDSYAGSGKGFGGIDHGKLGKHAHDFLPEPIPNYEIAPKNLLLIPFRLALALQADGWYVRQTVIWQKPNCLPESVQDRPTTSHEYVFLLAKSQHYYYDAKAIKEDAIKGSVNAGNRNYRPYVVGGRLQVGQTEQNVSQGRNKRSVWSIPTTAYPESHFAVMPAKLVEPCILAGTSPRACEHCGSPWQRVVERERLRPAAPSGNREIERWHVSGTSDVGGRTVTYHTGWKPTCQCEGNTGEGRCIVLDPFAGAGTVPMVAIVHHRDYLGVELNEQYITLIERRIAHVQQGLWDSTESEVSA